MTDVGVTGSARRRRRTAIGPWFRNHPAFATGVAAALATGAGVVGAAAPGARVLMLAFLALPVALVAVTFGRAGGLGSGFVGVALAAAWAWPPLGSGVGASGWAAAANLVLLGGLLGTATDGMAAGERRAAQADEERARFLEDSRRHAEAVEINDLMVQSLAVAKWALEAGDDRRALEVLDEICEAGQQLVSALLRGASPLADALPSPVIP